MTAIVKRLPDFHPVDPDLWNALRDLYAHRIATTPAPRTREQATLILDDTYDALTMIIRALLASAGDPRPSLPMGHFHKAFFDHIRPVVRGSRESDDLTREARTFTAAIEARHPAPFAHSLED